MRQRRTVGRRDPAEGVDRAGWYAFWWPLAKVAIGVAAVDRRNTVIDSYAP